MSNILTRDEVARIWGRQTCSNCPCQENLAYDNTCCMLLCRHCRARKVAVLRHLTVGARMERTLGIQGMVVPGTFIPLGV